MKRLLLTSVALFSASLALARFVTEDEVTTFVNARLRAPETKQLFGDNTIQAISKLSFGSSGYLWLASLRQGYFLINASTKVNAIPSFGLSAFQLPPKDSMAYQHLAVIAQQAQDAEANTHLTTDHASWTVSSVATYAAIDTTNAYPFLQQPSWDQTTPYNDLCPEQAPTGCVATASAQWMKTLQWPVYVTQDYCADLTFKKNSSDTSGTKSTYEVPAGTRLDYAIMPWKVDTSTNQKTRETCAIAQLMLFNDILSGMVFANNVSLTSFANIVSRDWIASVERYNLTSTGYTAEAGAAVLAAAKEGVPLLIALTKPAHAVLGGGYVQQNNVVYIHLNYGYSGTYDDYYAVDNNMFIYIPYPKRTVQCDPLPHVISPRPTLSWHLPKCYDDNISSFTLRLQTMSEAGTWKDDLTQMQGTIDAGTDSALYAFGKDGLTIGWHGKELPITNLPFAYTWPKFTPTASSQLKFTLTQNNPFWPLNLEIRTASGTWESLETFNVGGDASAPKEEYTFDLKDYQGETCELRIISGTLYDSWVDQTTWYQFKAFEITNILGLTTQEIAIENPEDRSYTFDEPLTSGKTYYFSIVPNFNDGSTSHPSNTQEATVASNGNGAEPATVKMSFSSPVGNTAIEATNTFRYCNLSAQSVIRLETSPIIKTLSFHSSHPTEFPPEMFSYTSHGAGVFDLYVAGKSAKPVNNDTMMLTVFGATENGTTHAHALMLNFVNDATLAGEEATPTDKPLATWKTDAGDEVLIPHHWLIEHNLDTSSLANDDPDGDTLSNLQEYLLGTHPQEKNPPLQITSLVVNEDGTVAIEYTPENKATGVSTFQLQGKEKLTDDYWQAHTDADTKHRFFRVKVEVK